MSDYSRIIDHPHHVSSKRPHMSMESRAAQFSPFAALTGYDEAVRETADFVSQLPDSVTSVSFEEDA